MADSSILTTISIPSFFSLSIYLSLSIVFKFFVCVRLGIYFFKKKPMFYAHIVSFLL